MAGEKGIEGWRNKQQNKRERDRGGGRQTDRQTDVGVVGGGGGLSFGVDGGEGVQNTHGSLAAVMLTFGFWPVPLRMCLNRLLTFFGQHRSSHPRGVCVGGYEGRGRVDGEGGGGAGQ